MNIWDFLDSWDSWNIWDFFTSIFLIRKTFLDGIPREHILSIPSCLKHIFVIYFQFNKDSIYNFWFFRYLGFLRWLIFNLIRVYYIMFENFEIFVLFFYWEIFLDDILRKKGFWYSFMSKTYSCDIFSI